MAPFDVIVLGLGAIGSATVYQLARAGCRVLGIDRYDPPHRLGSSHGETRITRAAVGEGLVYSPLAIRSHELWRMIEGEIAATSPLFVRCGCLCIAGRRGVRGVTDFLHNMEAAATRYHLDGVRFDDVATLRAQFPQFNVSDGATAFLDREGGYLFPESCIRAQLALAQRHGAALLPDTRIARFAAHVGGVSATTASGDRYEAGRLLVAAGAWIPSLLREVLGARLTVTRQVLHWFEIESHPERFVGGPVFIWDVAAPHGSDGHTRAAGAPDGGRVPASSIYGFPLIGDRSAGIKLANETTGDAVDPDEVDRAVSARDIEAMYETYVRPFLPDLGPRSIRTEVCLYTREPSGRFIIDRHPEHDRVMFASACSGHGFKHSAALGEALAEVLMGRAPSRVDLAPFRLDAL